MDEGLPWLLATASIVLTVGYELRVRRTAQRDAAATARSAHRALRGEWVQALSRHAGSEIVAVQALRNSLMSATINASTAVLVLMGAISLLVSQPGTSAARPHAFAFRLVLELALISTLFATYVCAAMAMRYYNHAGFAMSLPVGSQERADRAPLAAAYVQRAGTLYSWSLRCFLHAVPIAVGLLSPPMMPIATMALLFVLSLYDRAPSSSPV